MADFIYLFRGGAPDPSLSPEAMQQHMAKWGAWIGDLSKAGKFKAGDPLTPEGAVLSGVDKSLRDGPFAEAKDVVGGYLIVTAKDQSEAIELARGCPIFAEGGSLEVREIRSMAP